MPTSILNRYQYDALNRQIGRTPSQQPVIQHFHCNSRLTTEIQGAAFWSIVQHDEQLLALQQSQGAAPNATLLATDQQRSVLHARAGNQSSALTYTAYGHHTAQNGLLSLLGFNGERPDPVTGYYHLGNGYRQFNPVLMLFNSPDNLSPFGKGGFNAYAYCAGDPVNRVDPSGHSVLSRIAKVFRKTFLDKTIKNMKRNTEVSPFTVELLRETKTNLGGSNKIKQMASTSGVTAEELLLYSARITAFKKVMPVLANPKVVSISTNQQFIKYATAGAEITKSKLLHSLDTIDWLPTPARQTPTSSMSSSYQSVANAGRTSHPAGEKNRDIRNLM